MNPEKKRRRSPYTASVDTIFIQFTAELLSPDSPEFKERERKGRPPHSPSLPPEEPKPDQNPPAAT